MPDGAGKGAVHGGTAFLNLGCEKVRENKRLVSISEVAAIKLLLHNV